MAEGRTGSGSRDEKPIPSVDSPEMDTFIERKKELVGDLAELGFDMGWTVGNGFGEELRNVRVQSSISKPDSESQQALGACVEIAFGEEGEMTAKLYGADGSITDIPIDAVASATVQAKLAEFGQHEFGFGQ